MSKKSAQKPATADYHINFYKQNLLVASNIFLSVETRVLSRMHKSHIIKKDLYFADVFGAGSQGRHQLFVNGAKEGANFFQGLPLLNLYPLILQHSRLAIYRFLFNLTL